MTTWIICIPSVKIKRNFPVECLSMVPGRLLTTVQNIVVMIGYHVTSQFDVCTTESRDTDDLVCLYGSPV